MEATGETAWGAGHLPQSMVGSNGASNHNSAASGHFDSMSQSLLDAQLAAVDTSMGSHLFAQVEGLGAGHDYGPFVDSPQPTLIGTTPLSTTTGMASGGAASDGLQRPHGQNSPLHPQTTESAASTSSVPASTSQAFSSAPSQAQNTLNGPAQPPVFESSRERNDWNSMMHSAMQTPSSVLLGQMQGASTASMPGQMIYGNSQGAPPQMGPLSHPPNTLLTAPQAATAGPNDAAGASQLPPAKDHVSLQGAAIPPMLSEAMAAMFGQPMSAAQASANELDGQQSDELEVPTHSSSSDSKPNKPKGASTIGGSAAGTTRRTKFRRSRTGCMVCRKRKVKCDQDGLPCKQCRIGQRDCHYENNPPKRKRKAKTDSQETSTSDETPTKHSSLSKDRVSVKTGSGSSSRASSNGVGQMSGSSGNSRTSWDLSAGAPGTSSRSSGSDSADAARKKEDELFFAQHTNFDELEEREESASVEPARRLFDDNDQAQSDASTTHSFADDDSSLAYTHDSDSRDSLSHWNPNNSVLTTFTAPDDWSTTSPSAGAMSVNTSESDVYSATRGITASSRLGLQDSISRPSPSPLGVPSDDKPLGDEMLHNSMLNDTFPKIEMSQAPSSALVGVTTEEDPAKSVWSLQSSTQDVAMSFPTLGGEHFGIAPDSGVYRMPL